MKQELRGVGTVNIFAADHAAAKKWYADFLGIDPFGNILGIMYNPHYLDMLAARK